MVARLIAKETEKTELPVDESTVARLPASNVSLVFEKPFPIEVHLIAAGIPSDISTLEIIPVDQTEEEPDSAWEQSVVISHGDIDVWAIAEGHVENADHDLEITELERNPNAVRYRVLIRMKPAARLSYLQEQVESLINESEAATPLPARWELP